MRAALLAGGLARRAGAVCLCVRFSTKTQRHQGLRRVFSVGRFDGLCGSPFPRLPRASKFCKPFGEAFSENILVNFFVSLCLRGAPCRIASIAALPAEAPRLVFASPPDHGDEGSAGFLASLRTRATRTDKAKREGEPSFGAYLAQVGVLGWTIVIPALLGMFLGRWIDHRLQSGIFWTAPLLLVGLGIGCWGAWRWMHRP